jgi:hypothetical protein
MKRPRCDRGSGSIPLNLRSLGSPNRVEHAYRRDRALNLFAAFGTWTGRVYRQCHSRKHQCECAVVFNSSTEGFGIVDFTSKAVLQAQIEQFITGWN